MSKKFVGDDYYAFAIFRMIKETRRYIYTMESLIEQSTAEYKRGVRENKPRIEQHGKDRTDYYKDQLEKFNDMLKSLKSEVEKYKPIDTNLYARR